MYIEAVFVGMGGQGVLLAAQILAHAAVHENKNVVWYPAYGPETRGGTATCTLIVSDEEIGAPFAPNPDILVAFNQTMLDKYINDVEPGGTVIINSDLCDSVERKDVTEYKVPANAIALELNNPKVINMAMAGALAAIAGSISTESINWALETQLPEKIKHTIPLNMAALEKGKQLVTKS